MRAVSELAPTVCESMAIKISFHYSAAAVAESCDMDSTFIPEAQDGLQKRLFSPRKPHLKVWRQFRAEKQCMLRDREDAFFEHMFGQTYKKNIFF